MKKIDKDPKAFIHKQFEKEAQVLEKLQKKQARCNHKFIGSPHCLKCGFTPSSD